MILDLSESVQGLFDILKICDEWYLPYIEDEDEERKLDQFFEALEVMGCKKLCQKARMTEMKGEPEICVKKALQYDKNTSYGKAAGTGHGEAGSVERNRRWRTGRIDLSGAGRVHRRPVHSPSDEDGIGRDLFNAFRKLDILQELLEDETITEIMINGLENIFRGKGRRDPSV